MHHVFISYSTRETGKAEAVRNILEKNGIVCWMAPRDIPAGSNYTEEIPAAIRGCQVFLLILSENAQKSTWVPRELETAVNCGKVVIPFMVEDFQLNDEFNFLLGAKHRYAAYQNNAEIMRLLIERIRAIIGGEPPEPETEKEPKEEKQIKEEYQIQEEKQVAEPVHTAEEKREQSPEKKPESSLVEIPDRTPYCPVCGRKLIEKMKPIDGKDEEKINNRSCIVGAIFGVCVVLAIGIIAYRVNGDRDALQIVVVFVAACFCSLPSAYIGRHIGEKKVISLREKKGIDPYILYCKKCKKQFSRKED